MSLSREKQFNRKQISIIFKIAFLEAMALSIIMPSVTSTGEVLGGCVNGICSDTQSNTVTINIPACPVINCNAQFATQNIVFNPAFPSVPRVTVQSNGNELGIDERSWTVLTTTNTAATWVQPAAITELLGATRNEWVMFFGSDDNLTCSLIVNVINPGPAGDVLRVQGSNDGSTWANLQSSPNGDVPIDTAGIFANNYAEAGNGGLGIGGAFAAGPFFRVVGQGGNGINTVSFGNIYFECWWNTVFLQGNVQQITKTGFVLGVMILMPSSINPQPVTVQWTACTIGC